MKGDSLASGAPFAHFGPPKVTQERWNEIFGMSENKAEPKAKDEPKKNEK